MSAALAGIRVLELGNRSISLAGRILADLGADVILIEPPGGAPLRHEAPFLNDEPGPERGFGHLYFNINKRSVTLDLEHESDRARFCDLVATSDVLLESCPPGWLEERGLSHSQLRAIRASLVQCSVTPFGLATPWRERRANDLVAGAAGGLIQVSGSPQGTPAQGGANPSYTMSSLAAASAITIALHQRDFADADRAGAGMHIDLSMQEATALAVMQTATPSQWAWHQRIPRRPGLSAAMACQDGKYVGLLGASRSLRRLPRWADSGRHRPRHDPRRLALRAPRLAAREAIPSPRRP